MKKFLAAIALAFTLAITGLSACTTISEVTGQSELARYDEKALLAAELSYSYVLEGVAIGITSGVINRERAPVVKAALEKATAAIVAARTAYKAGQRVDAAIATRSSIVAVSEIAALLIEYGVIRDGSRAVERPARENYNSSKGYPIPNNEL